MKTLISKSLLVVAAMTVMVSFTACRKKDNSDSRDIFGEKRSITYYEDITMGFPENTEYGQFLYLQKGKDFILNDVTEAQQKYLAMVTMVYASSSYYLTFPADASDAYPIGDGSGKIFEQNPEGLFFWDKKNMNSGKIKVSKAFTTKHFDDLAKAKSPEIFDRMFRDYNGGKEFIHSSTFSYALDPQEGEIFLVQFNGLVRGFLRLNKVVSKNDGIISFDLIVESRESYSKKRETMYIQPEIEN